jgi:hypothetical protein
MRDALNQTGVFCLPDNSSAHFQVDQSSIRSVNGVMMTLRFGLRRFVISFYQSIRCLELFVRLETVGELLAIFKINSIAC